MYNAKTNEWTLSGGRVYQNTSVISMATTLANQPLVHQRISARGFERPRTRKNTAIIREVSDSPPMFN